MEAISISIFQEKKIYVVNFAYSGNSKEDTVSIIVAAEEEFSKNPSNSVLALINVSNAFFHFDTLKAFKNFQEKTDPFIKKVAIVGLVGLQKVGFNTVTRTDHKGTVKAFDSEQEAKEWLTAE
jgi:hypothetical protein